MQDALPGTYTLRRSRFAAAAALRRHPSFLDTLQSAFAVFARHPLPALACVLVCFAGAGIVGSLVYGALIGEAVLRTGSHTGTPPRAYNLQMQVQGLLGAFAFLIGRGALTWIALHSEDGAPDGMPITFRAALRAALKRWKPLLVSTLVYGMLVTLGIAGLTVLLRELRLDISNARWVRRDLDSMLNWTTIRALALLPPDPGSPFSEWLAATRYNMARASGGSYFTFDMVESAGRDVPLQILVFGLASATLLFVTETLLCLRTAAIVGSSGASGGALTWLRESLRVSAASPSRFWRVAGWRWTLRIAFVLFAAATLILPPALHLGLMMTEVRRILGTGNWPSHIAQSAYGVAIAFVSATLFAFGVAFEARMYAALTRK